MAFSLPWLTLAVIVSYILFSRWKKPRSNLPYPPGPKGKLFVGNIGQIPLSQPWLTYTNWRKVYGDIIHLRMYQQHIVILNNLQDVIELFEKRSNNYSDRPAAPMVDLMGWDFNTGQKRYGDDWRVHRKVFKQAFRPDAMPKYRPVQTRKVYDMLQSLMDEPDDCRAHYKRLAAAVVMSSMYGYDISPANDHFVAIAEAAVAKVDYAPRFIPINDFPVFRYLPSWFPGVDFKKVAQEVKHMTDEMKNVPFSFVKQKLDEGTATPCFVSEALEENQRGETFISEKYIKEIAGTAYSAGADTTSSALGTFFYVLATHPRVQARAQEEIDRVVGTSRLPSYEDRPFLPYIEAILYEIMRWRPPLPMVVPHTAFNDDIFKGYFIPKGTAVWANIWAINHDESVYTQPELFNPDRFIDKNGELNGSDAILAFGFGRRNCLGRHLASATIWLAIAAVLATFNIAPPKDEAGNDIHMESEYTGRLTIHPVPRKYSITPRSAEAERLIQDAHAAMKP
ncbi:cytochrome P450 [Crucibulum laeve]|uniref:Cytochrome P450 n=1 Tax=Crucibulum laeve TaxID=68775 RepID=A0A5C3M6P4_9AGAR|nr:cytochrome P450 [Crucibulum laeve]